MREVKKTVVVVCEGTKTEPQYVETLAREPDVRDKASVLLRIEARDSGEVPLTLVRRALDLKARSRKEGGEVDEIWCIFDVEWPRNHPHLTQAIGLAQKNGINLAISNPCFELWLVLHFRDCGRFLTNDEARRERRSCDAQQGKHVAAAAYMPHRSVAALRAQALDQRHVRSGTVHPHDNPSSGMYKLLKSISP